MHRHPDPHAEEVATIAQKAVDAFESFLTLSDYPCEPVRIPYQGNITLPGYLCISTSDPAPTIIFNEGKDGWAEDGKFVVDEAIQRGYNVLLWDGPGMGKTIRLQGLPFRHDWEQVLTPVIDYLETIPQVDSDNLALWSVSLGGFLGPRAAIFEHRLKALVANPGVMNWYKVYELFLNTMDPNLLLLLETDPDGFDAAIEQVMAASEFLRWGLEDSMWHHGVNKPSELIQEIKRFNIEGMAGNITTVTLVIDAEAEERGQAMELYNALPDTIDKEYVMFTYEEAAQIHVQPGATAIMALRIMNWLDERFENGARALNDATSNTPSAQFVLPSLIVAVLITCSYAFA